MEQSVADNQTVIFAGGCFWCTEHDLKSLPGVTGVVSGYSGGDLPNPDYDDVASQTTHHRECVQVTYDPVRISFRKLCQFFLDHIDPTDAGGQFYDRGESYRTAIFYADEDERATATSLLEELRDSGLYPGQAISVDVLPRKPFYPAETYHQDYAAKNPGHYDRYAKGSGRVQFVANTCAVRELKKIHWKE